VRTCGNCVYYLCIVDDVETLRVGWCCMDDGDESCERDVDDARAEACADYCAPQRCAPAQAVAP